tara:strand:- start:2854 stop:4281 length:1428 start_codon:yes stop_codon:yes gene_type:complete
MKARLRGEAGGVALIMVLAFMALGVPVITSTLKLADSLAIDSRVKTDALKRHYCGLGVMEYVNYLTLDPARWTTWWQNNQDPDLPAGEAAEQVVTICGESVTLRATRPPPADDTLSEPPDSVGIIPPIGAFNNRKLHNLKTAQPATASGGALVTYTITTRNRDANPINQVTNIEDELPVGFCYQAGSTAATVTSGSTTTPMSMAEPQIAYDGAPECPDPTAYQELTWAPPATTLQTGDFITLTFAAAASTLDGLYCNEVSVDPGGPNTRSGKTAIVQIGDPGAVCDGPAVAISKTVDSVSGLNLAVPADPLIQEYSFTVRYTITVENIGTDSVTMSRIEDLLPEGFVYNPGTSSGDISFNPSEHWNNQVDRWELTWNPNPNMAVPSKLTDLPGATKTLTFDATATVTRGDYWSDLLVSFTDSEFSVPLYTWPTGVVTVREAYNVEATGPDGETTYISLQILIGTSSGTLARWEVD